MEDKQPITVALVKNYEDKEYLKIQDKLNKEFGPHLFKVVPGELTKNSLSRVQIVIFSGTFFRRREEKIRSLIGDEPELWVAVQSTIHNDLVFASQKGVRHLIDNGKNKYPSDLTIIARKYITADIVGIEAGIKKQRFE